MLRVKFTSACIKGMRSIQLEMWVVFKQGIAGLPAPCEAVFTISICTYYYIEIMAGDWLKIQAAVTPVGMGVHEQGK
jgi:hypothetical protein